MGDPAQPVIFVSEIGSGLGLAAVQVAIRDFKYNVVGVSSDAGPDLQPLLNSSSLQFVQGELADAEIQKEALEVAMDEWGHIDALVLIPGGNGDALKALLALLHEQLENSKLSDGIGRIIIASESSEPDLEAHVSSLTSSNPKLVHTVLNTKGTSGSLQEVGKAIVQLAAGGLKKGSKL